MLTTDLLNRSLAQLSPFGFAQLQTTRFVHALQPAPNVVFNGSPSDDGGASGLAHPAGVNSIAVDRFEGRYLVSGGADASISIWDLEAAEAASVEDASAANGEGNYIARKSDMPTVVTHKPLETCIKSEKSHTFGITTLQFYPFDSLAFLSTSYDNTLKIWSSERIESGPSASFTLSSVIYNAAISPIASHLLVACGTQHPAVRLVDLRTGAATHSLAGHGGGAVLSVAWSPKDEHVLASGAADGTVRFWDVRRSASCLATLDMQDSIGVLGYDYLGHGVRPRIHGKAHAGPVNGILWTEDARHLVTTGQDEKIRVWDTFTGANTLASFGPKVRNRHFSALAPVLTPKGMLPLGDDVLLFPNDKDILMFELFEGRLLKRMPVPRLASNAAPSSSGTRNANDRVMALAWRAHTVELLSAHTDGTIRSWRSRTTEDAMAEDESDDFQGDESSEAASRKRKREILQDIERDILGPKITFT